MDRSRDFDALLARSPVRAAQFFVVALVLLALIIDGLDVQLLAFVAPVIITEWGATRAAFGPALAAALVGMAIGSATGGWLGDRMGRRMVMIASLSLFGVTTLLAGWARDVSDLVLLRVLSGIGFGGATPNGFALASEWIPQHLRARAITLLSVAVPLGGAVAAPLTTWLIPAYGWRGCFIACGAFTIVVAIAMIFFLPESPAYLIGRARVEAARQLVRRVTGQDLPTEGYRPNESPRAAVPRFALMTRANLRMNAGAWLTFFCIAAFTYAIAAWGPALFSSNGLPLEVAIRASFYHNAAAIAAALSASFVLGRFGSRRSLLVALCLSIALVSLLALLAIDGAAPGFAGDRLPVIMLMAALGATAGFSTATIYTLLSLGYDPAYRSTGIGFGVTVGRVGAITMIWMGGALLDLRPDGLIFLIVLAGGLSLALVGVLILDRHIEPAQAAGAERLGF